MAGVSADEVRGYKLEKVECDEKLRAVKFTTPEGIWLFAANFSDETLVWENETLPAGECILKKI